MKRIILLLCACALTALPLFASGSKEAAPAKGNEPATVRMWTFLNPVNATGGRNLALKKIIDRFEADNPGVKIATEPQQWDIMTAKFIAAHQAGNAPDVQWAVIDMLGDVLDAEAFADLEGLFVKDWSADQLKDIEDAYWNLGVRNGKHYQLSLSRNYLGIMYRADLFREKGIKVPFNSLDELVDAAKKLTEKDKATGVQRYGLGQAFSKDKADPPLATSLLLGRQGTLFDKAGKAGWSSPAGAESFKVMIDLIKVHKVTPESSISKTVEDLYQEFTAGQYAMITAAGVRVPTVRSQIKVAKPEDVEFMLVPGDGGRKYSPTPIMGWAVGVWSKSKVKPQASKFLQALVSPYADELWVKDGGQVPSRKSTISGMKDFFSNPVNGYLAVMAKGFAEAGWAQPSEFPTGGWRADLNATAQSILSGTNVEAALAATAKEFNERFGKK